MNGEVTFGNNQAQENFVNFDSEAASPYGVVEFDVMARNPYDRTGVMDMRAVDLPKGWFAALDKGSLWLHPLEEKMVHVAIWTNRPEIQNAGAEAIFKVQTDERIPWRKALVNIQGHMENFGPGHVSFPVGGVSALVRTVTVVDIQLRQKDGDAKLQAPLTLSGQVNPNTGVTPLSIHILQPDGRLATEQILTDTNGFFEMSTRFIPTQLGEHKVTVYTLSGGYASEAQSDTISFHVQ